MSGIRPRPNLSLYALISFAVSFLAARAFTSVAPDLYLVRAGYHIHHFWYGLVLMATGGWIGINYSGDKLDRFAASLYGLGGGLVGDEVGLLLTFGNYYASITYTVVVGVVMVASGGILLNRYRKQITAEVGDAVKNRAFLIMAFVLVALAAAYITSPSIVVTVSAVCLILLALVLLLTHAYLSIRGHRAAV